MAQNHGVRLKRGRGAYAGQEPYIFISYAHKDGDLLSIPEAERYFGSSAERQCKPTKCAVAQGAYVDSSNGNCWWWLRSPGNYQDLAAGVDRGGDLGEGGDGVDDSRYAVRPALWFDLNS